MPTWMGRFLTAPTPPDEDRTRLARQIFLLCHVGLAVILSLAVALPLLTGTIPRTWLLNVVGAVASVAVMALVHSGRERAAACLLVAVTWAFVNLTTLETGGVRAVGFAGNLVVVLMAGMLIGMRASFAIGGLSIALGLGLAIAQAAGRIPPIPARVTGYSAWLTHTALLVMNAGLLYAIVSNIQASLRRSRAAEARLRALVENSPDRILEMATGGEILFANRRAELTVGRRLAELAVPESDSAIRTAMSLTATTGHATSVEARLRLDGGEPLWSEVRFGAIQGEAPAMRLTAIVTDITARREFHERIHALNQSLEARVQERTTQLQAANRELEAFSAAVSHDLRAPVRAMDGLAQILLEDYSARLDGTAIGYLERVRTNAARMNALIDALISLARTDADELSPAPTDLHALAGAVFATLTEGLDRTRVELTLGRLPVACVDPTLFRQVLANVLGNALKYSQKREHAAIDVSFHEQDGERIVSVRDNGAGFDMKHAEKLFAPFQRLHRADQFEGSGIGLATTKRILERHGCRIWGEGSPNGGATFHFTIPGAAPAPSDP